MKETNEGLAIIGRTNQMQVWAQVYQSDLKRLRIGQAATVRAESGGFSGTVNARLASIVESISNRDIFSINGNNDVNARVVLVKLNVDNADQKRISRLSNLNVIVRFDK
jgi:HlyD family secretion protein